MSRKDLRREPRVAIDLDVTLETPAGDRHYFAEDASYRGIFLITSEPIPLRRLVRLRAELDDDIDAPLEMMGLVAHHLTPAEAQHIGHQPGMGIHLFPSGEQPRERWRAYLRRHYQADPEAWEIHRRLEMPHLIVHLGSTDDLVEAFDGQPAEADGGSIFVHESRVPPEGSQVLCDFVVSGRDQSLTLEGTAERTVESPPRERGVQLHFDNLDDGTRQRIQAFIAGELQDSDDPRLQRSANKIPDIPKTARKS